MTTAHLTRALGLAFGSAGDAVPRNWLALLTTMDRDAARSDAVFADDLTALSPRLFTFARRLSGSETVAEDLVQDTMVRAWGNRHRFERGSNMGAWAITILKRLYLTARHRDRFVGTYDEVLEATLSSAETQSATIHLRTVGEAIDLLKDEFRTALIQVVVESNTYEEVADQLGVSVETVKSRVSRARRALTTYLSRAPVPSEFMVRPTATANYARAAHR